MLAALPVLALAFSLAAVAQDAPAGGTNNSCIFAHDGECDEDNGTCAPGTDSADCRPDAKVDPANSCRYAFDQRCDEPGRGTGLCAAGTDTADCAAATPAQSPAPPVQAPAAPAQAAPAQGPNDDSCPFARDGDCDEPGIGSGACAAGTDATDCKAKRGTSAAPATPVPAAGPGDDSCPFARDGDCDEPGIGSGACAAGTDTTDCKPKQGPGQAPAAPKAGGDDSCQFAHDGECDEPGHGTGLCTPGTDTADCSAAGGASTKPNPAPGTAAPAACPFTGDGECDEPGKGSGLCAAGTDAQDCRGR
jgi:protease YdgD